MNPNGQAQRSFGDWLRQRRRERDLTREELAQQIGCSVVMLRKLEAEERRPSKQMAERLADVLQVPPDDRANFLRFSRGDPFAAPSAAPQVSALAEAEPEPAASPDAPTGTVTFLFTDIESSTRLLEQLRDGYAAVLSDQRDLLRAAFTNCNGHEIDTQGDAFFVAFPRALDALNCVIEAQQALSKHAWPAGAAVRVRMGLHTGEPILGRTGYVGMDVHRAARIAAAGHGGQVLLSQTTRDLIYQDLPPGASLRALGEFKLKDIRFAQPLYQLDIAGLPSEFAPLKTLASDEEPPAPGEPPFKGLRYFEAADANQFFGRDRVVIRLLEQQCAGNILAIIGASGSGKSSILRAGLLPALGESGRLHDQMPAQCGGAKWQVRLFTPTAHPLEALALCLTAGTESVTAAATLSDDMRRDARSLYLWVHRFIGQPSYSRPAAGDVRLLLAIDQFEELFTLCRDPNERLAFGDNLTWLIANSHATGFVLTLRADFYEHLAPYPALSALVAKHQEYIGAMDREELRQAIEAPAAQAGWEFSPGLVDLLLHDVGADAGRQPEPGALPLLSHALLETWKHRRGNVMNLRAYSESGGVRGAIAHTAEGVFQQEFTPPQQAIARNIFLRLTELGEGTQDTRRRVPYGELFPEAQGADVEEVLGRLADARLITTSEGTVEVAHEALIREWPTLRQWLDEDREGLRLHRHLTEAAQSWAAFNRDASELYRGTRLGQAGDWATAHPGQLNALEQEFLHASQAQTERDESEREAARRRELQAAKQLAEAQQQRADAQTRAARQLRGRAIYLAGALGLALILAAAALWLGAGARQAATTAQTNARLSFSRELAAAALSNLDVDPERSLLLALQALTVTYSVDQTWLPEVGDALHRSLEASRVEMTLRHPQPVMAVAYSPDGTRLATASDVGTATVWDLMTQTALYTLTTHAPAGVHALAFSPDGSSLATSSTFGSVAMWDVATGQNMPTLHGDLGRLVSLAFSPHGTYLGAVSATGALMVWDVIKGKELYTSGVYGVRGAVVSSNIVAFSPDETRVARLAGDGVSGQITIRNAATGQSLYVFPGPGAGQIAYSASGTRLTTVYGTAINVWDAITGQELLTTTLVSNSYRNFSLAFGQNLLSNFAGSAEFVKNLIQIGNTAFSPDRSRLATSSLDRKALIWDANTGELLMTLSGHTGTVGSLAFSSDGNHLATGSEDGTARIWNIGLSRELLTLTTPQGADGRVVLSPDGRHMAMGVGTAGLAKTWEVLTGQELNSISDRSPVLAVALSPDGSRVATTALERPPVIWNAATGQKLFTLNGLFGQVTDIVFSPDGNRIVGVSDRGTMQFWDVASGRALPTPIAESPVALLAVTFCSNGERLATSRADGIAQIRDASAGQPLLTVTSTATIRSLAFSPDCDRLAAATDGGTAQIWETTTGQSVQTFVGHTGPVGAVAFSLDGKRLATASRDGTVRIWDVATGQPLLNLLGGGRGLSGVAFSPDGNRLITSGDDGIRIYVLPINDLAALARTRVTRGFTLAECQQYLHLTQCPGQGQITPTP